jgi:hypothetical protein
MTLAEFIQFFTVAFWLSAVLGLIFYLLFMFFRGKI